MKLSNYKRHFITIIAAAGLAPLLTQTAFPQTTITYTYDANGRMVSAASTAGHTESVEYDNAGNITNSASASGGSGGSNTAPTCSDVTQLSFNATGGYNGLLDCSDADNDTLTLTNVTDPPGATTATINGNYITFANLACGTNTLVRTVSDGNGGTATSNFTVHRFC